MSLSSKTLFDFFNALPDCRNVNHSWKIKYSIAEMLMCLLIGFLNGHTSCYQAWHWCSVNTAVLMSMGLVLENGLASYATHMRMLQHIDPDAFLQEFIDWMNGIIVIYGVHLAIDGKGLRGGTAKNRGSSTPYVLNVVETSTGLVIASMPIDSKTNEITAIPQILALLSITANTFTIDAIGTQIDIMNLILEEEGSFLLLVKKNHPEAYANLVAYFDRLRETEQAKDTAQPVEDPEQPDDFEFTDWICEKNRDRMEYRRAIVVHINGNSDLQMGILSPISSLTLSGISFGTVGMIESVRIPIEKDENGQDITPSLKEFLANGSRSRPRPKKGDSEDCDIQKVGIISNLALSAKEVLAIKRSHWAVESQHHVLDVSLAEDYNPAKASKYNASLLRKVALNISTMALLNKDVKDYHSTPVENIHLAGNADLMKKYLFDYLPVVQAA